MSRFEDDELSAKLRAWKIELQVPAGFQREVWQRIAARQSPWAKTFWAGLLQWISDQLARPQYATAMIAMMLTSGIGFAHVKADHSNAKSWKMLEARYANSVNPLAMSR